MSDTLTNIDYERQALASVMEDNRRLDEDIDESLFTRRAHVEILRAIREIASGGGVAGFATVASRIPHHEREIEAMQSLATPGISWIVGQLRELRTKRDIQTLCRSVQERIHSHTSAQLISDIDSATLRLSEHMSAGYRRMSEATMEAVNAIEAASKRTDMSGGSCGLNTVDGKLDGFQDGELAIIGARPSTGKTAFALQIAESMCRQGRRVGIFSAEMAAHTLASRMLSRESGIAGKALRTGMLKESEFSRLVDAAGRIDGMDCWIDDTPNIEIAQVISGARQMRRNEGINAIIIDYLGLLRHERTDMPRWERMGEISARLKGLSRELSCPVVALSQITRDREGKRPTLASIRDSGAIEQDADVVMFLHSDHTEDSVREVEVIVAKNRNGETGSVRTMFDAGKMTFREVAGD